MNKINKNSKPMKKPTIYKQRPCHADDCDNWVNNPELCQKCLDSSYTVELECEFFEDDKD
jgi:hypothetical protein